MAKIKNKASDSFITLPKSIFGTWIWKDEKKLKWWLDILFLTDGANSVNMSLTEWAKRWGTSRSTARRFLEQLYNKNFLENHFGTVDGQNMEHLTVCKSIDYKGERTKSGTVDETPTEPLLYNTVYNTNNTQYNTVYNNTGNNTDNSSKLYNKECIGKDKGYRGKEKPKISESDNLEYNKFLSWIEKNAPNVLKMQKDFTCENFEAAKKKFTPEQMADTLKRMHNWKPLCSKNIDPYLTMCQWLAKTNK